MPSHTTLRRCNGGRRSSPPRVVLASLFLQNSFCTTGPLARFRTSSSGGTLVFACHFRPEDPYTPFWPPGNTDRTCPELDEELDEEPDGVEALCHFRPKGPSPSPSSSSSSSPSSSSRPSHTNGVFVLHVLQSRYEMGTPSIPQPQ